MAEQRNVGALQIVWLRDGPPGAGRFALYCGGAAAHLSREEGVLVAFELAELAGCREVAREWSATSPSVEVLRSNLAELAGVVVSRAVRLVEAHDRLGAAMRAAVDEEGYVVVGKVDRQVDEALKALRSTVEAWKVSASISLVRSRLLGIPDGS